MRRPLKQLSREHFERPALSANQLDRLEKLIDASRVKDKTPGPMSHAWFVWGIAAVIATLVTTQLLLPLDVNNDVPMTEQIALEVALNHIKLKPLDVRTDNMEGVRRYFTDLEFIPAESQLLASVDLELLGGRYCSIQRVPAAQLRISTSDSEKLKTLYQTEYVKNVFGPLPVIENGDKPATVNVKGLRVRIWVEKGLLFALTEEAGPGAIRFVDNPSHSPQR